MPGSACLRSATVPLGVESARRTTPTRGASSCRSWGVSVCRYRARTRRYPPIPPPGGSLTRRTSSAPVVHATATSRRPPGTQTRHGAGDGHPTSVGKEHRLPLSTCIVLFVETHSVSFDTTTMRGKQQTKHFRFPGSRSRVSRPGNPARGAATREMGISRSRNGVVGTRRCVEPREILVLWKAPERFRVSGRNHSEGSSSSASIRCTELQTRIPGFPSTL